MGFGLGTARLGSGDGLSCVMGLLHLSRELQKKNEAPALRHVERSNQKGALQPPSQGPIKSTTPETRPSIRDSVQSSGAQGFNGLASFWPSHWMASGFRALTLAHSTQGTWFEV